MLRGRLTTTDAKGGQETVHANDLFYWPPGHNVRVEADAEIVMFSPQRGAQPGHRSHDRKGQGLDPIPPSSALLNACSMQALLLEHGYHDLGIEALLEETAYTARVPSITIS